MSRLATTTLTLKDLRIFGVHQVCEISTIIQNHVEGLTIRPKQRLLNAPNVFLICLALPSIHCHTFLSNGSSCMILSREDVARTPLNLKDQCKRKADLARALYKNNSFLDLLAIIPTYVSLQQSLKLSLHCPEP